MIFNLILFLVLVDLSDEQGNVKNLIEHGRKYANDVLKPRGTFVLIKVESKLICNNKSMSWLFDLFINRIINFEKKSNSDVTFSIHHFPCISSLVKHKAFSQGCKV